MASEYDPNIDLGAVCAAHDVDLALKRAGVRPEQIMDELIRYPGWAKAILLQANKMMLQHRAEKVE